MELHREKGLVLVPNPLVGAIVHVHEPRLLIASQLCLVHRVTMILRGDVAVVAPYPPHRLVMPPVAILQFIGGRTGRLSQDLVPHADPEDRLLPLHRLTHVRDRNTTVVRIARPVGDHHPVVIDLVEVVIPRYSYNLYP